MPASNTPSVAAASAAAALFAAAATASGGAVNQPLDPANRAADEPTDANAGPGTTAPDPAPE